MISSTSPFQARLQHGRKRASFLPVFFLALALVLVLVPHDPSSAASKPAQFSPSDLGPPTVSTGSGSAMSHVSPDLLRQAKQSSSDALLDVIIVSDGPIDSAFDIQDAAKQRPDVNGLAFTTGRSTRARWLDLQAQQT